MAGRVGQAFSFNGGAGFVALPSSTFPVPTTGNTSTRPFSFETWFATTASGIILAQQSRASRPTAPPSATIPAIYVGVRHGLLTVNPAEKVDALKARGAARRRNLTAAEIRSASTRASGSATSPASPGAR